MFSTKTEISQYSSVFVVAFFYISASLQNVTLLQITGLALKPIHVVVVVSFFILVSKQRAFPIQLKPLITYLCVALLLSLIPYLVYGGSALYINYFFVLVLLLTVAPLMHRIDFKIALKGLKLGAWILVTYSATNILMHLDQVALSRTYSVSTGARPAIDGLIYGGGINLEATWIALASTFFIKRPKQFLIYSLPALAVILSLSSRAAIIVWVLAAVSAFFPPLSKSRLFVPSFIAISALLCLLIFILRDKILSINVVQRFLFIGNEPGSIGRENLWTYFLDAFTASPIWGYGLGNEVHGIELASGLEFWEDNVHNLYAGNLLALGLIGFSVFILCFYSQWKLLKGRPEAQSYLMIFLIVALVEFRGADTVFYMTIVLLSAPCISCVKKPQEEPKLATPSFNIMK